MNQPSHPQDAPSSGSLVKERAERLGLMWFWDSPEIREPEQCLVLGVVAWSVYDARLLTLVSGVLARGTHPGLRVAVFDLDELASPADVQRLLTTAGTYEPPPISHWAPGPLKDAASEFVSNIQHIFPGIGEVYHSPAVGYWESGQLKETAFGFYGRQLVGRLLGFDPKLILEQPNGASE